MQQATGVFMALRHLATYKVTLLGPWTRHKCTVLPVPGPYLHLVHLIHDKVLGSNKKNSCLLAGLAVVYYGSLAGGRYFCIECGANI